jgi:hypothetical protein
MAEKDVTGFGIATECGFSRRPQETIPELLQIRRAQGYWVIGAVEASQRPTAQDLSWGATS